MSVRRFATQFRDFVQMSLQRERNRTREVGMGFGGSFDRSADPGDFNGGPFLFRRVALNAGRIASEKTHKKHSASSISGRTLRTTDTVVIAPKPYNSWSRMVSHSASQRYLSTRGGSYHVRTPYLPQKKSCHCGQLCICIQHRMFERARDADEKESCIWQ